MYFEIHFVAECVRACVRLYANWLPLPLVCAISTDEIDLLFAFNLLPILYHITITSTTYTQLLENSGKRQGIYYLN